MMQHHIPEEENPQPSEIFHKIFSMESVPIFCTSKQMSSQLFW